MLANVKCFFSPPAARLLISMGVGEGGILLFFFFFFHWLLPYLLQRDTSPLLIVFSVFYSPSWMLGTPHPVSGGEGK